MTYTEAYRHYIVALRADPKLRAPRVRAAGVDALHEWKNEMRAFDAAQIELGIATAQEVQMRNSAVRLTPGFKPRIISHAKYT